ncbi:Bug family tripartite tricarboxylate transporter substrate binding protein [Ottowia thiooxydans]|uniref:Tripartite-type tricarboxylate transporter receptor subunit TctC n=1 Tax=Ottowia thiooxydans TaxID=219182 RepID=A0ABV2Q5Q3_9BURK
MRHEKTSNSRALSRRRLVLWSLTASLAAGLGMSTQAASWPGNKPIRIVVPYAVGGSGDVAIRSIQKHLEKTLGGSIYIDNKSGASGNIGATDVARSAPDGYTFLLGATNNYVMNQFLFKMTFDPLKDLVPVSLIVNSPLVVMVNPGLPAKTLGELSAYAKRNPGKANFGSPGPGTAPHLGGLRYNELSGAPLTHVAYRGAAPAVQALLGGEIQAMFVTTDSTSGHVLSGRLRALAVAGTARLAALPDVPTTAEAGLPGLVAGNWWGLSAPAGTDPAIINKMVAAIKEVMARPEVIEQFAKLGTTAVASSPKEFSSLMAKEATEWKALIQKSNVTLE